MLYWGLWLRAELNLRGAGALEHLRGAWTLLPRCIAAPLQSNARLSRCNWSAATGVLRVAGSGARMTHAERLKETATAFDSIAASLASELN